MLRCNPTRVTLLATFIAIVSIGLIPHSAIAKMDRIEIERLIQDATSASGAKRLHAIEALGNSGDLRALQPVLGLLYDVDPSIREHALKALRTLAQELRQLYTYLAQWIDSLLLRLDINLAPEPPVERTQYQRVI
ncbi:HEAT repeat domain-containing protein [Candidatus Entotheonella palauensis]|uniref:HEAT repeat domain-containing protein n=1 Tax=Candidatus Entotheonella gemina TaxID=1429439 RepID=W4MBY4_9BACT|nr:HEAT repeat domain-containing protein [Candidatus Entotheonella palauensis]ETX07844.1 MAG: hypothetical protein ETSY2_08845 [Candidatus Entotheonella gemina]